VIWAKEFVQLDKTVHDRASFDCGEAALNKFIQEYAARHMEASISTTMVLPAAEPLPNGKYPICAFYTITASSILRETLPASYKKRLPTYPIGVFLLAQLAVHSDCQKQGLGKITLIKALEYLWDINNIMRVYAVIVDCLNEKVEKFYSKYNFEILDRNAKGQARMFLPMRTIGMLFPEK
jgi:GNAT superfamily N-acetyltransferase